MSYTVNEIFYSLQGEGAHAGRPAVFCRFAGCNLWNGRESDRSKSVCQFCDTDFVGGNKYQTAEELAHAVNEAWKGKDISRYVICTGGEPLLQVDELLIAEFHKLGFEVAVETNGTQQAPDGLDWICVSPKANAPLKLKRGNELKLVYPQPENMPEKFERMEFQHFFIQPKDGEDVAKNTQAAIAYCLRNPFWSLSLQTHKQLGIE